MQKPVLDLNMIIKSAKPNIKLIATITNGKKQYNHLKLASNFQIISNQLAYLSFLIFIIKKDFKFQKLGQSWFK